MCSPALGDFAKCLSELIYARYFCGTELADIARVDFVRIICKFCDDPGSVQSMKHISAERLDELDRQLLGLPRRSSERRLIVHEMAAFYWVSDTSLYRALRSHLRPKAVRRADRGLPRVLPCEEMERYC